MSNIDAEIKALLSKHSCCDEACPELWLVKELQRHREALKALVALGIDNKERQLLSKLDL